MWLKQSSLKFYKDTAGTCWDCIFGRRKEQPTPHSTTRPAKPSPLTGPGSSPVSGQRDKETQSPRQTLQMQVNRRKEEENSGLRGAPSSKEPTRPWWQQQLRGLVPTSYHSTLALPFLPCLPTVLETVPDEGLIWLPHQNASSVRLALAAAVIMAMCPALGLSGALETLAII